MEYFIGVFVGCIVTTIIFYVRRRKAAIGTFFIADAENENSAIGIALKTMVTKETTEIILTKQSRK